MNKFDKPRKEFDFLKKKHKIINLKIREKIML
jgi:hypothetical protein